MNKTEALKLYFGHQAFRPGQEALVDALLAGQDVLGVMPTGAGKSVCYQLPALLLPGLSLVVSPLISLMKDQVAALTQAGAPAAFLNSSLTSGQMDQVLRRARRGEYKILYVAPERLNAPGFQALVRQVEVPLLAVDEAHCVSQWGQDFRPSYLGISQFIASLSRRPAVGAFTATATAQVREDIEKLLPLVSPLRAATGFDRPNLFLEVVRPKNKEAWLLDYVAQRSQQSGIVYCSTRKTVEAVCQQLLDHHLSATRYHAGLEDQERRANQEAFVFDQARVMVATNAFGMGIDKSNVSFVVHYNMPKNIENYYQEAGRAGRDGEPAHCVLLFSPGDVYTAKFLINNASENQALSPDEREQVRRQDLSRLEQMEGYCRTGDCLRARLLEYFGEEASGRCGNCGNCTGVVEMWDITVEAQKILSAVARVEKKYRRSLGAALVVQMLHGGNTQKVRQLDLNQLPTYGIMREIKPSQIRGYIDCLLDKGYLYLDGQDYPVLRLTSQAKAVLFQGERVVYVQRGVQTQATKTGARVPAKKGAFSPSADMGLFEVLRALRAQLAVAQGAPAYTVFSNATLMDMSVKQPETLEEFRQVSGVGEVKAVRYGKLFIEKIVQWKKDQI